MSTRMEYCADPTEHGRNKADADRPRSMSHHTTSKISGGDEELTLTWISDMIFRAFPWVPHWLYADYTPQYFIVRAMLGLLLIVVVISAIAAWYPWRRQRRKSAPN